MHIERIENEKRSRTGILNLSDLGLKQIPDDLLTMPWLKKLSLSRNEITKIEHLHNLVNLEVLYLFHNEIKVVENLENLPRLRRLDLSDNHLNEFPDLSELSNLQELFLSRNPISHLPENIDTEGGLTDLFLDGTLVRDIANLIPLVENGLQCTIDKLYPGKTIFLKNCPIPGEIIRQIINGSESLLNYFKDLAEQGEVVIYEARLLVLGEAGVGKTSFSLKIKDPDFPLPDEVKDTTVGVSISTHVFPQRGDNKPEFKMNVWDFGGQNIYHSIHQLFMGNRSLYVIICNGRTEDNPDNYWLPIQKMLTTESPVLVIVNKKGDIQFEIPFNQLKIKYPNLKGDLLSVNFKNDRDGIISMTDIIEHSIRTLPQFKRGEKLPKKWVLIREKLDSLKANYITIDEFKSICESYGIADIAKQRYILDYFSDMGVVIYFDSPFLKKYLFLNTEWITHSIYNILNHTKEHSADGSFSQHDLEKVWTDASHQSMFDELLAIMKKFEICYELPLQPVRFLVPKHVRTDMPDEFEWDIHEGVQVKYEYDVMPKGILERLIVRLHHQLSKTIPIWKFGAVFETVNATAVVLRDGTNLIVAAKGPRRAVLIEQITGVIDNINTGYVFSPGTDLKKLVSCICPKCKNSPDPAFHKYDEIIGRYSHKIKTIDCGKTYGPVLLEEILLEVFNIGTRDEKKGKSVFISYSKDDNDYMLELRKHLSFLPNDYITWCDHDLQIGTQYKTEIISKLNEASVIVFLVSANLFSTKFIKDVEIPIILQRYEAKDPIAIVPVIIKPCLWEESPLGQFTVTPFKGQPVNAIADRDEAWKTVVNDIKTVVGR